MVFVIKYDGRREEFDPEKIRQSCLRSGATPEKAEEIVEYAKKKVYDGMSTKKLMKLVYAKLNCTSGKHIAIRYSLKEAITELGPEGYEFEWYVAHLLREDGYKTIHSPDPKLKGHWVDHEIDVLAQKGKEKVIIECKHHFKSHTWTGLEVPLIQWARLEDLDENGNCITGAWIITNTKFSEHAIRYSKGKNIRLIGWNYPPGQGLEKLIERERRYPLTVLKMPNFIRWKLIEREITNIIEFNEANNSILSDAGLSAAKIKELKDMCFKLLNGKRI